MRTPVAINVLPYDLEGAQPRLEAIRNMFSQYLDNYIPKSRSKHGIMGPVGKILSEVKSGRSDPDYLKGYVLRIHELSQTSPPSPQAITALEDGINLLVQLLRGAPLTVQDQLIGRIDYGLYFSRRKKSLNWLDERNRDYRAWLQNKYADLEALNQAWKTQVKRWDDLRYGGLTSRTYGAATAEQRQDMDRFAQEMKEIGKVGVVEADAEEENL